MEEKLIKELSLQMNQLDCAVSATGSFKCLTNLEHHDRKSRLCFLQSVDGEWCSVQAAKACVLSVRVSVLMSSGALGEGYSNSQLRCFSGSIFKN